LLGAGRRVLHGEAVAVGLIAEAYIGRQRNLIGEEDFKRLCAFLLKIYGKVNFGEEERDAIAGVALQDKKNKGNIILSVLPDGIGGAKWDYEISLDEVKGALSFYRSLQT
jgi:3-dehydroquinate synthase